MSRDVLDAVSGGVGMCTTQCWGNFGIDWDVFEELYTRIQDIR